MDLSLAPEQGVVERDVPLARSTTWRIGGPARYLCRVRTEDALARVLGAAAEASLPLAILGMGSNVLVADEGFPGCVLRLEGAFLEVRIDGERVRAGGGAALGGVCAAAARAGLSGIEAISGIPSSIGGAVRINAGAYGGEIFDVLETVRLVARSGERRVVTGREVPHAYRWSGLIASREIVSEAVLRLSPASRDAIEAKTKAVSDKRRGALPSEPNAGSVFRNPEGDYAGRLIEACGLKGERRGDALISPRHANVIVNLGHARAVDVLALMRKMRDAVRERFGVTLSPEVELLGLTWD
ncbi:MAG TPA: UDP-N-acetylmuramate dehydrogenase [Thermoanaerobaculia bacterium]|jgi:UDP-N-acetylmuramate dehydrogenase|nr:UDP-N-acetylmuramate dehydrogenase [Thermoanaerobaculia bacterium]